MADETVKITVSHNGREKRIPLVIQPSLELSDFQVDEAELELSRIVQHVFNVPAEAAFFLHEVETDRIMTKESFRDPSYLQEFPRHWYLTVEKGVADANAEEEEGEEDKLYPQYTGGSEGEYSTGEGNVTARNIPVVVGGKLSDVIQFAPVAPEDQVTRPVEEGRAEEGKGKGEGEKKGEGAGSSSLLHPSGLAPFSEVSSSANSLDHLQSNSSSEQLVQGNDDVLITGSLSDILVSGPGKGLYQHGWAGHKTGSGSSGQLDRLDENELYTPPSWQGAGHKGLPNGDLLKEGYGFGQREVEFMPEGAASDPPWYQDPEDGFDPISLSSQPQGTEGRAAGHTHSTITSFSQDSVPHLTRGSVPRPGENQLFVSHSQPNQEGGSSAELGIVRLKKHGKTSLGLLTSLPSSSGSQMRKVRSDDQIGRQNRAQEGSGMGMRQNSLEEIADQTMATPTETRPPENVETAAPDHQLNEAPPQAPPTHQGSEASRSRRAAKSYKSQRQQLHKSRSKTGEGEGGSKVEGRLHRHLSLQDSYGEGLGGRAGTRKNRFLSDLHVDQEQSAVPVESAEPVEEKVTSPQPPVIQVVEETEEGEKGKGSREERGEEREEEKEWRGRRPGGSHTLRPRDTSPPRAPHTYQSATLDARSHQSVHHRGGGGGEQYHKFAHSVEVPLRTEGSRRLPIYKTRSAQTPYGNQVFSERNIDDAVAASQGAQIGTSGGHSFGMDRGVMTSGGSQGVEVGLGRRMSSRRRSATSSDERLYPPHSFSCHGMLGKKQVSDGHGRRSSDRSWRSFYTVLTGTHMVFFKDRRDADANKPCDEPPLEVVPGRADLTHGYTKRKSVFRVVSSQGAEYLLQSEDSQSMLHWVTTIHRLNGAKVIEQPRPREEIKLVSPNSPLSGRRNYSPQPQQSGKGRKKVFMKRLRNAMNRKRDPNAPSEPSFGQPLAECPMSPETKYVPLVVEYCVREVEEHGLEVEGLYRKPGQVGIIRNMVADMDKGNFEFDQYGDIHTIGSLLKKFFQELPDALIPADMYKDFLSCIQETQGEQQQLTRLRGLVFHLPTAHYHTLRYLTAHLNRVVENSEVNKMGIRNVSLVFGPTLMLRSSPAEEFDLGAMNTTFTVVEMLCRHWQNIFDADMCYEEQQMERERQREERERRESDSALELHHRTASDTAVNSIKVKKDHSLFNASPKMVRRIKNHLGTTKKVDRNSYAGESLSASMPARKQHNRSDTLPSYHSHISALLSPSHVPTRGWGRAGSGGALQTGRHRDAVDLGYGGDLNPHARYPQSREAEWGDGRREHVGSMWAKGKEPQRGKAVVRKETRDTRDRGVPSRSQLLSSHPPPPPIAHQQELLLSYQQPSPAHRHPHHEHVHRSSTLPSPEHHGALSPLHTTAKKSSSTLPGSASPTARRKISYNMAVGDYESYNPHHPTSHHRPSHHNAPHHSYSVSQGYSSMHRQRSGELLPLSSEDYRESDFTRSYAYGSARAGNPSRLYPSQPERGEPAHRSKRNHESYL